jgi:ketosteroid isomerase-like protein
MKQICKLLLLISFIFFVCDCSVQKDFVGTEDDRKALEQTSINIRAAFSNEDIPTILTYHHPKVRKALGYKNIINGHGEMEKDLNNTFAYAKLNWLENNMESLVFQDNTAIEMTAFTIAGTPKDGSQPFTFKGRAMIVYVRSRQSPTGWVSLREIVQPEN